MAKKLTDKQNRFCEEYIVDLNATQAAIRAGYSKKTANRIGSENLSKPDIQNEIQRLKSLRSTRTQIEADSVVQELVKVAFSNIKHYLDIEDDEVYFKDLKNVTDEESAAIESVKVMKKIIKGKGEKDDDVEVQAIQFKLHSKVNALVQLGRHLGIFDKDNQQRQQPFILVFNHKQNSKKLICKQS